MNLHKSKIDWCTHTWNPVTGCLHGCDYCYAKRFIARFEPHACEMVLPEPLEFLPDALSSTSPRSSTTRM